ncbi:MAG TPA: hypothetical protein DHU33_02110 [Firmicutes bacterium]|nr:hypothetical protein [Bacillota bacterium]
MVSIIIEFLKENWANLLLITGGFVGLFTYFVEKRNRQIDYASLIVMQIEDLKNKISNIKEMVSNNLINEKSIYESLDLIVDNQWEKYKHLFIKKIDSNSFKTINSFYEAILEVREQLQFVKLLQHTHYIDIQNMLDSNCNAILLETIRKYENADLNGELHDSLASLPESQEKDFAKKFINRILVANPNINYEMMLNEYNSKKQLLISVIDSSPYKGYIPIQVSETINKMLKKLDTIEIIGCSGFHKLQKIARIKK